MERAAVSSLLIDNYDSFTYNLYQLLSDVLGAEPIVLYNNASWEQVQEALKKVDCVVLSPGPGW